MSPLLAGAAAAALAAGPLSPADLDAATAAWRYFERNTDRETGLVRSVDGYPGTSAWDLGSSLLAVIAARELGVAPPDVFDAHVTALLATLAAQPLFRGVLPNKAYDTSSGAMTDYANRPAPGGTGYSAIDVGRLASALVLLGQLHPERRAAVEKILARWDTCAIVRGGELHGVHRDAAGALRDLQEGRLGYEQYAAKAFALLGRDASAARRYDRFRTDVSILGVRVPRDLRDAERFGAVDAVVSEPWILDALEFGLDGAAVPLARRVFDVQKRRWETTGIITALTEDHVDRSPWFVYDAIWADGTPWRTVASDGMAVAGLRALSTKAALGFAALYPDDPYAAVLRRAVQVTRNPARGWYAGVYEKGPINRALAANTNAVVLEAILFQRVGPLHAAAEERPGATAWRERIAALGSVCAAALETAPRGEASGGGGSGEAQGAAAVEHLPLRGPRPQIANGSFFVDYRGTDRGGLGGIATVFPRGFWFLRFGGEATPYSKFGSSRFLWGFGYDDWHDGTFSATVHNWGPVRPEDGLGADRAEFNFGYKVPKLCSGALCAALYPSITVPFQGGPYAGGRLTLTFHEKWFVMGGLGWTIPGALPGPVGTPAWRLFYGFGLYDWRPGTLFVTYNDWGPNEHARNGVLAVGLNWRF